MPRASAGTRESRSSLSSALPTRALDISSACDPPGSPGDTPGLSFSIRSARVQQEATEGRAGLDRTHTGTHMAQCWVDGHPDSVTTLGRGKCALQEATSTELGAIRLHFWEFLPVLQKSRAKCGPQRKRCWSPASSGQRHSGR